MVVLYHGRFPFHWVSSRSISNLKWLLLSMIHNIPTLWNTEWRTKGVITLLNNYPLVKCYVTALSQFFHLMHINIVLRLPSFQILIENIWNNFNNERNIILSPYAWKATCSKMPSNWNHTASLSSHLIQWSRFIIWYKSLFRKACKHPNLASLHNMPCSC